MRRQGTSVAAPEAVRQAVGGGLPKRLGAVTVGSSHASTGSPSSQNSLHQKPASVSRLMYSTPPMHPSCASGLHSIASLRHCPPHQCPGSGLSCRHTPVRLSVVLVQRDACLRLGLTMLHRRCRAGDLRLAGTAASPPGHSGYQAGPSSCGPCPLCFSGTTVVHAAGGTISCKRYHAWAELRHNALSAHAPPKFIGGQALYRAACQGVRHMAGQIYIFSSCYPSK